MVGVVGGVEGASPQMNGLRLPCMASILWARSRSQSSMGSSLCQASKSFWLLRETIPCPGYSHYFPSRGVYEERRFPKPIRSVAYRYHDHKTGIERTLTKIYYLWDYVSRYCNGSRSHGLRHSTAPVGYRLSVRQLREGHCTNHGAKHRQ